MKILHVLYSGLGGHGNVFFSMVDGDVEKTNEYVALFFGIEDVREGYKEKATLRNIPWHFVKKKPGFDFKSYSEINKIIKQSLPDIIFLHSSAYIFPAKKAVLTIPKKIKIVVRETQPNHLKTKLEWVGLSFALLFADKVVFLSTEYRDHIKKRLSLFFSDKRTAVIPNGVDLDVYKPAPKESTPFITIGMQSRLSETKDHKTLVDAFNILLKTGEFEKPVKLYIAGDGNCREALENQVKELDIRDSVVFTGMLEETQLSAFINSLDIYIHASLGETMSTAIMQAMACAKPVVASDVDGISNMIKNNVNGILVPAKDEMKLALVLEELINNLSKREQLAKEALIFAKDNFSNLTMFEGYKQAFLF